MPIKVTCSNCRGVLHAPDDSAGKRGRCPTCGTVLTIIADGPEMPPAFGAPSSNPTAAGRSSVSNPWGSLPGGPDEPTPPTGNAAQRSLPNLPAASSFGLGREQSLPMPPAYSAPHLGSSVNPTIAPPPANRMAPDPRKHAVPDPFSKSGKPPTKPDDEATLGQWRKVRRGLGWVQMAVFFAFLALVGYAAIPILSTLGVNLPAETPGFLKINNFSQTSEIHLLAVLVPLALSLLTLMIGRMTVSGAPASSGARGLAVMASLATLLTIGGFGGYAGVTGMAMKDAAAGWLPDVTWPKLAKSDDNTQAKLARYAQGLCLNSEEMTGQIQRIGGVAFLAFGLLAEVWFIAALGRMGPALQNSTASRRVNRALILLGLAAGTAVLLVTAYHTLGRTWADDNLFAKWELLDERGKALAIYGGVAVLGLLGTIIYWRMLSGVKRAIREHAEPNGM